MTFALTNPQDHLRVLATRPLATRISVAEHAVNPLLEAARVLLQALADTPSMLDTRAIAERREWLEHEVRLFNRVCAELQLRSDHAQSASYCLCSALDEAAMQSNWGRGEKNGAGWQESGLAVAFGYDRQGGDRVYRIIEEALRHPRENIDLIEVIQNILDLGFKGRYRFEEGGRARLQVIRDEVHDVVVMYGLGVPSRNARSKFAQAMPRWQPDPWVRPTAVRKKRWWITVGIVTAALMGAAGYAAYERLANDARLRQEAQAVGVLARKLGSRFEIEIAAGSISLEENESSTSLTVRINDMFASGAVTVNPWAAPLVATIGREIAAMPGKMQVHVIGYTDSVPASAVHQRSNHELSVARAKAVVRILLPTGVPVQQVGAFGNGDADPLADNQTVEGRAKNRRVEITVHKQ